MQSQGRSFAPEQGTRQRSSATCSKHERSALQALDPGAADWSGRRARGELWRGPASRGESLGSDFSKFSPSSAQAPSRKLGSGQYRHAYQLGLPGATRVRPPGAQLGPRGAASAPAALGLMGGAKEEGEAGSTLGAPMAPRAPRPDADVSFPSHYTSRHYLRRLPRKSRPIFIPSPQISSFSASWCSPLVLELWGGAPRAGCLLARGPAGSGS